MYSKHLHKNNYMKLKPGTLIKDFPPKLQELVLKRAWEHSKLSKETVMFSTVESCFTWSATPEGMSFWHSVNNGYEFKWEEDSCPFKEGDRVTNKEVGDAVFVRTYGDNSCFLECSTQRGWPRNSSIPADYVSRFDDHYWCAELRQTTLRKEDKWAIRVPIGKEPSIVKFFTEKNPTKRPAFSEGYYYHYPPYDNHTSALDKLHSGYREIFLDEFRKITNYSPQETMERISEIAADVKPGNTTSGISAIVYSTSGGIEPISDTSVEKLPEAILIKKPKKKLWHLKEVI